MISKLIAFDCEVKNSNNTIACAVIENAITLQRMGLYDRLQTLLERLKISQREFARRAKLKNETDVGVILHRLRADPNATVDSDTLRALARAGGVTVDWLLGIDEPEGAVATSLEDALDAAWVPGRHSLRDAEAVRAVAKSMAFSLADNLVEAARAWLDAAASLRRESKPVTTESLLLRLTLGRKASESQELVFAQQVESLRLQIEADIQALGVEPTKAHAFGSALAARLVKLKGHEE